MVVTRNIVRMVLAWAELRTAQALGLVAKEETIVPSYVAASSRRRQPAAALHQFMCAYGAWWLFHAKVDAEERSGQLSSAENAELLHLIDERDAAREALIELTAR